jgi:hypothetical protein
LVVVQTASEESFRANFRRVADYIDAEYRRAGTTSFDDPRVSDDAYRVLMKRDAEAGRESGSGLPCDVR